MRQLILSSAKTKQIDSLYLKAFNYPRRRVNVLEFIADLLTG